MNCLHRSRTAEDCVASGCSAGKLTLWEPDAENEQAAPPPPSLVEDAEARTEYPMAEGLLDYFPNALAEVSRLSFRATQQHHPDEGMHWDRTKSLDHRNKILRHLVDTHTVDDKGNDHWAMVCWRALAGYQEYLEAKHGLPPSRASRNRPETFGTR